MVRATCLFISLPNLPYFLTGGWRAFVYLRVCVCVARIETADAQLGPTCSDHRAEQLSASLMSR